MEHIGDLAVLVSALTPFLVALLSVRAGNVGRMQSPRTYAWCPSCCVALSRSIDYGDAAAAAQVHAGVTGHAVHLCWAVSGTVFETVAGEQSLPLWDDEEEDGPAQRVL